MEPLVFGIVLLVLAAAALVLFLPLREEAPEERPPELITQPYAAGEPVEQPTPYYAAPIGQSPDPLDVATNLDKKAFLASAMLFGVFALTGAYFLLAPQLRVTAGERQLQESIERGAILYATLCFDCHGRRGEGLVGLPLNKPTFRATCALGASADQPVPIDEGAECKFADDQKAAETISKTVARGRERPPPTYSMPAWSRDEGGPLNAEQIRQLVSFIMRGDWEEPLHIREEENLSVDPKPPGPPAVADPVQLGRSIAQSSCMVCHSFDPNTPSANPASPNLGRYATEGPFTAELKALKASGDPDWLKKWVTNAPAIKPGTAMPKWEGVLTAQQIDAVVQYVLSLK